MSQHSNGGKVNILVSREFARHLKQIAVHHGETIGAVVERLSRDEVKRERKRIHRRANAELGEAGA